jgi:hypothetical protein
MRPAGSCPMSRCGGHRLFHRGATPRVPPSSRVVSLTAEKQPLGSALNHLQLVGETLSDRGEPHPFAEATLIRTAITAASYSLWTLHDDATERRNRALQFNFKDLDGWGGYYRTDRQDPAATEDDRAKANDVIVDARRRKEWIVELPNLRIGASQMFRDVERCPWQAVRVAAQETRSDQNADAGRFLDDVIVSRQALLNFLSTELTTPLCARDSPCSTQPSLPFPARPRVYAPSKNRRVHQTPVRFGDFGILYG